MFDLNLTTFTMQIIDSDPEGIKICRVQGSSLVTVVIPRWLLATAKTLPEIPTRGVYYLLRAERGRLSRVYAGQTTNGIERLDSHNSKKGWWNTAVMFLAPENEMSGDVVGGLEAMAIAYIHGHGDYEVDNAATPKPYVSPYNVSYINNLHSDMVFRMAVLGYNLDQTPETAPAPEPAADEPGIFHTHKRGIHACGRYHLSVGDPGKGTFEVLPGSEVDLATPTGGSKGPNAKVEEVRQALLTTGGLVQEGERYVLKVPQTFASPSAAAVFVLGGSQNGWTEWVDAQGATLKEVYHA